MGLVMFYYVRRRRRVYILYGRMTTIIIRRDRGRYAGRVDDKTKITIEKRFNKILTVGLITAQNKIIYFALCTAIKSFALRCAAFEFRFWCGQPPMVCYRNPSNPSIILHPNATALVFANFQYTHG